MRADVALFVNPEAHAFNLRGVATIPHTRGASLTEFVQGTRDAGKQAELMEETSSLSRKNISKTKLLENPLKFWVK